MVGVCNCLSIWEHYFARFNIPSLPIQFRFHLIDRRWVHKMRCKWNAWITKLGREHRMDRMKMNPCDWTTRERLKGCHSKGWKPFTPELKFIRNTRNYQKYLPGSSDFDMNRATQQFPLVFIQPELSVSNKRLFMCQNDTKNVPCHANFKNKENYTGRCGTLHHCFALVVTY